MAKKKRATLKPVANRGFATTSMPSKKPSTVDGSDASSIQSSPTIDAAHNGQLISSNIGAILDVQECDSRGVTTEKADDGFDAAREEEQALQNVVDRLRQRVDKDVTRFWKTIEYDRRLSKQLPIFELDSKVQDEILACVASSATTDPQNDAGGDKKISNVDDVSALLYHLQPASAASELLQKALVTQALLLRLGFTSAQAIAALSSCCNVTDIDECVAWLAGALTTDELDAAEHRCDGKALAMLQGDEFQAGGVRLALDEEVDETKPAKHEGYVFERSAVLTGAPLSGLSGSSTPIASIKTASASTPATSGAQTPVELSPEAAAAIESFKRLSISQSCMLDDQEKIDTLESPDVAYAHARLFVIQADKMVSSIERHGKGTTEAASPAFADARRRLHSIKARARSVIDECQLSPRWNKAAADDEFQRMKVAWEDTIPDEVSLSKRGDEMGEDRLSLALPASHEVASDGNDDDEGLFGDLLDEQVKDTVDDATQTHVVLRELPAQALKAQGSKAPRSLLSDALRRRDPSATVRYEAIATGGRMHRSRLTMRWQKGFVDTYTMTSMATLSASSADDLLAVAALMCVDDRADKLLGAGFREWWTELAEEIQEGRNKSSRQLYKTIVTALGPRLEKVNKEAEETKRMLRAKAAMQSLLKDDGGDHTVGSTGAADAKIEAGDEAGMRLWEAREQSKGYHAMLAGRERLPIAAFKEHFLALLELNQVIVLSGETGCGKSTQIPTYIVEHRLKQALSCKVYVTEPRRISAISLAERVSAELGEARKSVGKNDSLIGSAVRLENKIGRNARLVFATTGIVLRMLEGGQLEGVTHVVVDEVHERSIDSDFLLIILKSLLLVRKDLKVILMSATLDAERISAYFDNCPTVNVPGRTFPVDVQWLEDAVELCDYTIESGSPYALRRRRARNADVNNKARLAVAAEREDDLEENDEDESTEQQSKVTGLYKAKTISTLDHMDEGIVNHELIIALLEQMCFGPEHLRKFSSATLVFLPGIADIRKLHDILQSHSAFGSSQFQVWPLHSTITSENQSLVFDVPPAGVRKIVLSTNIAETGITIPDITCVIDSGKHREMRFDEKRQMSKLVECFVARSNAKQRRGRAGRVQHGICWHLFTRFRHDNFLAEHAIPEILRLSLQDLALKLKVMKVRIGSSIEDALGKALDAPSSINIQRSIASLVEIKALTTTEDITALGRQLSRLPLDVHMAKFLLVACSLRVLDSALTIAATLNAKSPFVVPFGRELEARAAKRSFNAADNDFVAIVCAFNAWRRASENGVSRQFCQRCFLSETNLVQIEELRQQYMTYLLDAGFVQVDDVERRELVGARFRFQAHKPRFMRVPAAQDVHSGSLAQVNATLVAALYPKLLVIDARNGSLRTLTNNAPAIIHPSSVNAQLRLDSLPHGVRHLVFYTIMQSRRLFAWETAAVDERAMLLLCGEADFKFSSKSLYLDRQRFRITFYDFKTALALRWIRQWLLKLLQTTYRTPGKAWSEEDERLFVLACAFLGVGANDKDRVVV